MENSAAALRLPRLAGWASGLRAKLGDRSDSGTTRRAAGTAFLIRVLSAAVIYASQIVFARWMGGSEFGVYVYVWTWILVVGEFADLGIAGATQRFIPEYTRQRAFDLLRGYLRTGRLLVLGFASALGAAGALLVWALSPWLEPYLILPLMIGCATLPFYALVQLQESIAQSYDWTRLALLPMYLVRHLLALALFACAYAAGYPADAVTLTTAVALSLVLTAIGQTLVLNRRLRQVVEKGPRTSAIGVWVTTSLPILMVGGFYLMLTHTDVLVLQHLRTPAEVALFYAASKTLALVAFVYFAVAATAAHRFTAYHVAGDKERLAGFLAESIRWTFWPSLAATLGILAVGRPMLALFGPDFVAAYPLMFILALGMLARASIGPVERLLSMVGEQRLCAAIYAAAFALNLVLCLTLIPRFGVDGAAWATTTAILAESLMLFLATRRRLGLHVFIVPRTRSTP